MLMVDLSTEDRQWKFISSMEGDIKVIFNRLDTIENNHLKHMQDDLTQQSQRLWMILMVVFAQLFAICGGMIVLWVTR